MIEELLHSSHEVKMITGDNALTAAYIGQKLKFGAGERSLFAVASPKEGTLVWNDIDDVKVCETSNESQLYDLAHQNLLCISGDILG